MLETDLYQKILSRTDRPSGSIHSYRYHTAVDLFKSVLFKGKIARLFKGLTHRPLWLNDLVRFRSRIALQGSFYAGIKVVEIDKIVGSEGRTADFDIDFHPVREASRERWVNMALLQFSDSALPPVQLTQIGEMYFVRDGHHRISVAHALGQKAVDAEVTVWKTCPSSLQPAQHVQLRPAHLGS